MGTNGCDLEDDYGRRSFVFFNASLPLGPLTLALSPEDGGEGTRGRPPIRAVPSMMEELVAWLNAPTDIHPVLVSGLAQFQLVHIHPFVDGNGRTSRLLSTLCLHRVGYDFNRREP